MRFVEKTQIDFAWTTGHWLLLLLGLSAVKGVQIEPCGEDGIADVLSDQNTSFTCRSEGNIQWKLLIPSNDSNKPFLLSNCTENVCNAGFFGETFVASVRDNRTKMMTVNTVNNIKIYRRVQLVNGSLWCDIVENSGTNESLYNVGSASCGLNYVYPPENVECKVINISSSINVSCVIGSVYSSRRIYKCQLFTRVNESSEKSLGTVRMVTSPTSLNITKSEVKVSGFCQFNTSLPAGEEHNDFIVSISPGGRNYSVKVATDDEPPNNINIYNIILAVVPGVIVLVVISLVICLIIKKKSKDGRRKESNFTLYVDPRDIGKFHNCPDVTDIFDSLPISSTSVIEDIYEYCLVIDSVPVLLTMDDVPTAANTRIQQNCFVGSEQDESTVPAHLVTEEMEAEYVQIQESESFVHNAVDNSLWKSRCDDHPDQDDDQSTEKTKGRNHGTNEMVNPYLAAKDLQRRPFDPGQQNQVSAMKMSTIEESNDDIADNPPDGSPALVNHESMIVGLSPRQLKSALHTEVVKTAVSSETGGARGQTFGDGLMSESSCFPEGQQWEDLHVHEAVYSLALPT